MISSILPMAGVADNAVLVFPAPRHFAKISFLLTLLNSLVFDYVVRQKIAGAAMSHFILYQLPVLSPAAFQSVDSQSIVPSVLELVYTSWDIKPFADYVWRKSDERLRQITRCQWEQNKKVTGGHEFNPPEWAEIAEDGIPLAPFKWNEGRRARLRAELDAYFALLYGLNRKQLRYILDPADLTRKELEDILDPWEEVTDPLDDRAYRERAAQSDFPGETFRVLKEKELKLYGEYRTRRLVLEAFEKLVNSPGFRDEMGKRQSALDNEVTGEGQTVKNRSFHVKKN